MFEKFYVSRKLDAWAKKVEDSAPGEAQRVISVLAVTLGSTMYAGIILQVCSSAYRLLRLCLSIMVTDTPEGEASRKFFENLVRESAKRIRDASGLVTLFTKNAKIMSAIRAFEDDWEELQEVLAIKKRDDILEKVADYEKSCIKFEMQSKKTNSAKDIKESEAKKYAIELMKRNILAIRALLTNCKPRDIMKRGAEIQAILYFLERSIKQFPKVVKIHQEKKTRIWEVECDKYIRTFDPKEWDDVPEKEPKAKAEEKSEAKPETKAEEK